MNSDAIVYLIDDTETDRLATANVLLKRGLSVQEYADSQSFLKAFDPLRVSCLVVNMRMPGLDGLELQEKLIGAGAKVPIIFISGEATIQFATVVMRMGALDMLEKPVDPERLLECVSNGLDLSREGQQRQELRILTRHELNELTPTEREVLPYICAGYSLKQITARFAVNFTTAARYQGRILEKLNSCTPMQLLTKLQSADIEIETV